MSIDLIPVRFLICGPDFSVKEASLGLARSDQLRQVPAGHPWSGPTHLLGRSQCRIASPDEYSHTGRIAYRVDSFGAALPIQETVWRPVKVGMPSPDERATVSERLAWCGEQFADLCEFRLENGHAIGWHIYHLLAEWSRAADARRATDDASRCDDEMRQYLDLARMFASVLLDGY